MNSLYFAQYLANVGAITPQDTQGIFRDCVSTEPGLAVVALSEGVVSASKLAELAPFEKDAFADLAVKEGVLFTSQVEKLRNIHPAEGLKLAQTLLDQGKMDFIQLGKHIADYDSRETSPVKDAVRRLAGDGFSAELDTYADFTELFMRSFMRFMNAPAVVSIGEKLMEEGGTHIVSQRLLGALSFVSGIYAEDAVLLEIAKRYSHEEMEEVDELAEDSIAEFLNVVNGLFVVDLGKRDLDIDLDTPRVEKNKRPMGSHQLEMWVETGFGFFALVLAADEFAFKGKIF